MIDKAVTATHLVTRKPCLADVFRVWIVEQSQTFRKETIVDPFVVLQWVHGVLSIVSNGVFLAQQVLNLIF